MINTNRQTISNAPTNSSTAKALYSFQKAKRFAEKVLSTDVFYDLPPPTNKRTTSFGYGLKYDFTRGKQEHPGPGTYKIEDTKHKSGFSFGFSREQCRGFIEGSFKPDSSIPGPGTYTITPKFSNEGRKYTLKGREKVRNSDQEVPGPGAYNSGLGNSPGKYVVSNMKNQKVYSFSPKSSKYPKDSNKEVPPPGAYDIQKGFLGYSKILSTCKSSGSTKFGVSQRKFDYSIKNTPGPGSYRLPSDFGYYELGSHPSSTSSKSLISQKSVK